MAGTNTTRIEIFGLSGIPEIKEGDNIAEIFIDALHANNLSLEDGDVIVFASKIISKSEGRAVLLSEIKPSEEAVELAERMNGKHEKDPRIIQMILDESREILRIGDGHIIVETKHGFVCANAGIDASNVPDGLAIMLPEDPQRSADALREEIERRSGKRIAVLIADSHGRAFRDGVVGTCIGVSGIPPILDRRGEADRFGRIARVTKVAVADEICAAANLVMGELGEGIPIAIVRGLRLPHESGSIEEMLFSRERDLFR